MAKVYIYSTMSSDNKYTTHTKLPNGLHKAEEALFIAGKANVSNPVSLITPRGMMTPVEEAEYKKFADNEMLKRHIARGFIVVAKSAGDADKVAEDMTPKDGAAQLTAADTK